MGKSEDLKWKQDQDLVTSKESDKLTQKIKNKIVKIKEMHSQKNVNHVPCLYTRIPKETYKFCNTIWKGKLYPNDIFFRF